VHPLDNPAWHALRGPHRALGEHAPLAARYRSAVTPFAALPDEPTDDAWRALAALLGPGRPAVLFRDRVVTPDGWQELFRMPTVQMVGPAARRAPSARAVRLGAADVAEMLELTRRTQPGPFAPRTIELGTYLGIRDEADGALVAMAGERMRFAGHTEISAVCTDDARRGRGLGTALVCALVASVVARGETPFLHALATNETAIRLYERLGFTLRRTVDVVGLRPRSAG
jgi:ribosomal protein S18 acetylase RimI-like enzyme